MTYRSLNADFTEFLSALKRCFNNSKNGTTGRSPNEIIYGTNLNDSFGVVLSGEARDFEQTRKIF